MQESISDKLNEIFKTTQSKTYFIAFMTFLFVLILVLFGILPAYSAFIFQSNENVRRDDLIAKLDKKLTISKDLTTEYTTKGAIISYLNQIFPSESTQDNIIQTITASVNKDSAFLQSISFVRNNLQDPSDTLIPNLSPKVQKQQISVLAQGTQANLLILINDLETSGRIFNIKSVSLSRKTEQEIASSVLKGDYKVILQMYYYYYDKTVTTH